MLTWIDTQASGLDCTKKRDPGRVTIRRLNRNEYNNTVRDLVGVKFRPGGFSGFLGRPVHEITDRSVALADAFGAGGRDLEDEAAAHAEPEAKIACAEAFLRARMPPPDPEVELVHAVVIDMLSVDPGKLNALIESRSLSPDVEEQLLASREEVRTQHALYLREAEGARR